MLRLTRIVVTALMVVATISVASAATAATGVHQAKVNKAVNLQVEWVVYPSHATSREVPKIPLPTPTGCPQYQFCSYIFTGPGQDSSDICLHGGNFTNWGSHSSPFGNYNCHKHSGALVNAHTTGAELLYSSTGYNGQQACIAHNSYYDDTRNNHYSNGAALYNNINSSKQDSSFACNGG